MKRPRRLVRAARRTWVPGRAHGVTRSLASATIARNSLLGLKTGTGRAATSTGSPVRGLRAMRSEEHTSELQSRLHLVCRLLLEKKKVIAVVLILRHVRLTFLRVKCQRHVAV